MVVSDLKNGTYQFASLEGPSQIVLDTTYMTIYFLDRRAQMEWRTSKDPITR